MSMAAVAYMAANAACAAAAPDVRLSLWNDFVNPPDAAKPWSYFAWFNGQADRESITADIEAIKRLGFGGINMLDSRGYHDSNNPLTDLSTCKPGYSTVFIKFVF